MDKLYTGDIPSSFHYAVFGNYYIDLYERSNLTNGTFPYYRVYTNVDGFYYNTGSQSYSSYSTTTARDIEITDNYFYRRDFDDIVLTSFIYILLIIFLLNLVTSSIKKGGLLGGLL